MKFKFLSFNNLILEKYFKNINKFLSNKNIDYYCLNLPKKIIKINLLRSPHIDKDSRDQVEYRIYSKLLYLNKINKYLFLKFLKINLPSIIKIFYI
ncbi:30S ribosomal protein S10 [Candidatus Vidania fulgoroideorum]